MKNKDPLGWNFLSQHGLNLTAVLDTTAFPEQLKGTLCKHRLPPETYGRLILIGNGGGVIWPHIEQNGRDDQDPIDDFSIRIAEQWVKDYVKQKTIRLYPKTEMLVPLQQLGVLANWCHPSPLGSSISPVYGPWFAYRVALVTTADLPLKSEPHVPSPCDSCIDKPCMTACPVKAVQGIDQFQIQPCLKHRLTDGSPCADRCLSRLACPVGTEHRYQMAQIQHHYTFGRENLRQYIKS